VGETHKKRGAIKFVFWTAVSLFMIWFVASSYTTGQMARWFYYQTDMDGYAVNTKTFKNASKEKPAILEVTQAKEINGPVAILVKKSDRLPENANGVISMKILGEGKRAKLEGNAIKVMVPWQVKEVKGFKYKDTFIHKGVVTNPWSGVWNVAVVIALGLTLGLMAEGFTDFLGWKIKKIDHYGH